MIKEITMPAGGQTTDTSTVGTWLVKKGDKVNRGDELLSIETDKATLTVESFAKGTVLALLVQEGDKASAGEVIALIGDESDMPQAERRAAGQGLADDLAGMSEAASPEDEDSAEDEYQPIDKTAPVRYAEDSKKRQEPQELREKSLADNKETGEIKAMPNAKLLAKEHKIFLTDVADYTGKTVLKRIDVQTFLNAGKNNGTGCTSADVDLKKQDSAHISVPLTSMRRTIARRMLESSQNIPVFKVTVEVDMERCIAFRKKVNDNRDGLKISYNDILFKCIAAAMQKYPYVNASFTEDAILLHEDVNMGLAISVDGGLVVPVVKKVNAKSITEISKENKENISKAREGRLSADEMSGGTITLSNLGMYPVTQFDAIINPPEVCILAVGAVQEKPVPENDRWKMVSCMNITGSFDHRVVDGAYGAQFLTELKKIIEDPAMALL